MPESHLSLCEEQEEYNNENQAHGPHGTTCL
jgi:hypothetical protein